MTVLAVSETLLSLIFVPALTALLIAIFIVMMVRSAKPDTVIMLMYQLKVVLGSLDEAPDSVRELKKLDMRLSHLQMLADKAGYEELDVSLVQKQFDECRKITSALYLAERIDCAPYFGMLREKLVPAAEYLSAVTGVDIKNAEQGFKGFSAKAKRARAEKYLDSAKK